MTATKVAKKPNWYAPLRRIQSKGQVTEVVGGLAGLHAARESHQGQFFTPDAVAALMWQIAGLDVADDDSGMVSVLDNSFGSGRLFQLADPSRHSLYGIEIDDAAATAVRAAVKVAGFRFQLETGSMETFRRGGERFDVAVLNPPFSLHIDSPLVEAYPCNAHGRYGPRSSAISHRYAVAQALQWSDRVVAVVPRSFAAECRTESPFSQRLIAIYHLPRTAFQDEGADVETSIVAFDRRGSASVEEAVVKNLARPGVATPFATPPGGGWGSPRIDRADRGDDTPVVTLPVTGDKSVRVAHNGRRIVLGFRCGATQARVLNLVYRDAVNRYRGKKDGRLAAGVRYVGEGQLDLENHLAQPDPLGSFETFLLKMTEAGFEPIVDLAIRNWLRKRARRLAVLVEPFRHSVNLTDGGLSRWLAGQGKVVGVVKKEFPVRERPSRVGTEIELTRDREGNWSYAHNQRFSRMGTEQLLERFDLPEFRPEPNDWTVVHRGLAEAFPVRFRELEARARRLGLDRWCTWGYQFHDLCEIAMKRGNTIVGWEMGLGKARLAAAICFLGEGRQNLIVVEAHLVKEMVREFEALGLPADEWQVIEKGSNLRALRRINVIAYSRLKLPVDRSRPKATFAKLLRRRVHTMVCDEAHLLRNPQTDQSRAVHQVSPKVRYALSGTPIANYPRDVLPLIQWVGGDGTAHQPFGLHHPHLDSANVRDMNNAIRGVDVFREMFVTLEWVTNEFAEDLRSGAKREVPKIKDVAGFRAVMAPVLKRRVMEEPDVAAHVRIPRPIRREVPIEWDRRHLAYYVQTARRFVDWFKNLGAYERKSVGLIAILAKMQAVYTAANFPQAGTADLGPFRGMTSKQRYAVDRLKQLTADGHKTIFLAHSPDVIEFMSREMTAAGIPAVEFHGGMTVAQRVKALDERFRFGDAPVLLATKGVLQTGYNLHQANRVLFYDRSWTPKVEQQAAARALRPQQTRRVEIEFLHLAGSIDEYQSQMVEFKADSMKAGLDFGDDDPEREFVHIETILGRFVEDFEGRFGTKVDDLIREVERD